jgi:hypothetical protein
VAGINVWPVGQLGRTMEPGGKKVKIALDFGRRESLLDNWEFWKFANGNFANWTKSGIYPLSQKIKDGEAYAFLAGSSSADSPGHIEQLIPITDIAGDKFVFEMDYCPVGSFFGNKGLFGIAMVVTIVLALTDGSTIYFLQETSPGYYGWSHTLKELEFVVVASMIVPTWNKISIVTPPIPIQGQLNVLLYRHRYKGTSDKFYHFYQPMLTDDPQGVLTFTGIAYSKPRVYFTSDGQLAPSSLETLATFNNSTEPNDLGTIDILYADAPDIDNKGQLYSNISRLANGIPTLPWHIANETTAYMLIVQLARLLASNNRIARQKLSGTIKGNGLRFNSIIKHEYNSNREFEISEGSRDLYAGTWNVILTELLTRSSEDVTFEDTLETK